MLERSDGRLEHARGLRLCEGGEPTVIVPGEAELGRLAHGLESAAGAAPDQS